MYIYIIHMDQKHKIHANTLCDHARSISYVCTNYTYVGKGHFCDFKACLAYIILALAQNNAYRVCTSAGAIISVAHALNKLLDV